MEATNYMNNSIWIWHPGSCLHIHYIGDKATGYRIEPPEADDDDHPFLGQLAGKFNCILPGGDASVTYDTLEQGKRACEDLYQLLA